MSSLQGRKLYTVKYKLQVIKWYHAGGNNAHAAAKHSDITRSVLICWLAKKDLLKKAKLPEGARRMRGCKARYSALDADIYKFLGDEWCARTISQ